MANFAIYKIANLPKQTANIREELINRFEFVPKHVNNNGALSIHQLITGPSF